MTAMQRHPFEVLKNGVSGTTKDYIRCFNFLGQLGDLWEEVIEFSTYGPAERAILKERREAKVEAEGQGKSTDWGSFQKELKNRNDDDKSSSSSEEIIITTGESSSSSFEEEDISFDAMKDAIKGYKKKETTNEDEEDIKFDGYAFRDLIVDKWGAPLDIDFVRAPRDVYCSVMPVAYGSKKCRHQSEMEYLMHLQAVIEILVKYNNLDKFVYFLRTTKKQPKRGTGSVPYRLELTEKQLIKILTIEN